MSKIIQITSFRASVEFYSSPTYMIVQTHVGLVTRVMLNFAALNLNEINLMAKGH